MGSVQLKGETGMGVRVTLEDGTTEEFPEASNWSIDKGLGVRLHAGGDWREEYVRHAARGRCQPIGQELSGRFDPCRYHLGPDDSLPSGVRRAAQDR